ncbi:MAG: pyruvate formate lyase activating enzyme [Betaproteobacteria bacterium]|nr:pyruvate formate lyase activating enzyme [Betaproteobacteria bacterium]
MPWYLAVADNRAPAKFRIAGRVPVAVALDAPEEALWVELEARMPQFLDLWNSIRGGRGELPAGLAVPVNLVDLCREIAYRMLAHCNFCRYDCQVDRSEGARLGTCKLAADSRVSTYFHHRGEELVYRGTTGSGTIFFTSCNRRCAFCQNGDISTDKDNGRPVSARTLATMAWLLRMEGCHNINWVGGEVTIHLHTIVDAISQLEDLSPTRDDLAAALPGKADYHFGFPLNPRFAQYRGAFNALMLWNSNFFMSAPAMKLLRILMDVWLPDFKFGPGRCAPLLSKTPFYWETVTENLKLIHDWGEDFTIRHLVMPNHVECCTAPVLKWVAEHMPDAPVNIMDQYHPDNFCDPGHAKFNEKYRDLARRATREEIRQAFRYGKELGIRFESLSYEKNSTGLRL